MPRAVFGLMESKEHFLQQRANCERWVSSVGQPLRAAICLQDRPRSCKTVPHKRRSALELLESQSPGFRFHPQPLKSPKNVTLSKGGCRFTSHRKKETFSSLNSSHLLLVTVKKSFKDYQYCITKSEVICLQNIYRI